MSEPASGRVVWIARIGTLIVRFLAATWRIRFVNPHVVADEAARGQPIMYVLWHGHLLPLLWAHRGRGIAVMISEHKDGEIIARVALALGYRVVRGSTSRGAARALLGACREIEEGHDIAVTPDGPRGPARSVAPGAPVIAQRTGAPMVPVAAWASRAWRLKSWDRFMIPKPFARLVVAYVETVRVDAIDLRDATGSSDSVRAAIDAAADLAERAWT